MSVARLVILLVSAECGVVPEGAEVAALLDTAGAQVMVGGIFFINEKMLSQCTKFNIWLDLFVLSYNCLLDAMLLQQEL